MFDESKWTINLDAVVGVGEQVDWGGQGLEMTTEFQEEVQKAEPTNVDQQRYEQALLLREARDHMLPAFLLSDPLVNPFVNPL